MKIISSPFLLASVLILATVVYGKPMDIRYKRSDDPAPLEAAVHSLETTVLQQAQTISQLQAELTSTKNSLSNRIARQERAVAFNARLSGHKPFDDHDRLILDVVMLNTGNGYDKLTGVFTAPVSGHYLFSLKITHEPPGRLHAYIYKNQAVVAETESSGDDTQYGDRSSTTVVVHLVAGDKVHVERVDGTSNRIYGYFATSFEGILVVADHP